MDTISEEMKIAILEKIGRIVKIKAIRLCPVDMGALRRSIDYRIENNKVTIFAEAEYAEDMEYGKPPEPVLGSEEEELKGWAKRHKIPYKAVKKKLETKGIEVGTPESPLKTLGGTYRPFMRPALLQSIPDIKIAIKEMV